MSSVTGVAAELREYIIDLVRQSRQHADLMLGGSPRAAIYLMRAARVHALMRGRVFLTHEDVQSVSRSVLGHRIIMRPEAEMDGRTAGDVIAEVIAAVPVLRK